MYDPQAKQKFLRWVAVVHPDIYRRAMSEAPRGVGSLGFIDIITSIVGVGTKLYAEKKAKKEVAKAERAEKIAAARENAQVLALLQQNAARARAGQAPIPSLTGSSVASYTPYLLAGGGILVAVLLIRRK